MRRHPDARGSRSRSGSRPGRGVGAEVADRDPRNRAARAARLALRRRRPRRSRRTRPRRGVPASRASAGIRTTSPGRHGRPCGRKTRSNAGPDPRPRRRGGASSRPRDEARPTPGSPSRASSIAGASTSARDRRPNRACASPHERTAPGTVIASGPRSGSVVEPARADRARLGAARRPPGAVQRRAAAPAASSQTEPERVAADPAARRHDDREDGVRRDRRVDRGAARAQDARPGLGREVVRRDDGAARAAGERRRDERTGPSRRRRRSSVIGAGLHAELVTEPGSILVLLARSNASGTERDGEQDDASRRAGRRSRAARRRRRRSGCR